MIFSNRTNFAIISISLVISSCSISLGKNTETNEENLHMCNGEIVDKHAFYNRKNIERQSTYNHGEYKFRFVLYTFDVKMDGFPSETSSECVIIDETNNSVVFNTKGESLFCSGEWDYLSNYPVWIPYESSQSEGYSFSLSHNLKNANSEKEIDGLIDLFQCEYSNINLSNINEANNFAFYLSKLKRYEDSISTLIKVIKANPERIVAYLNIADSYYLTGNKDLAKINYIIYQRKMRLLGQESLIPNRVYKRIE